jgi:hypothetical protein
MKKGKKRIILGASLVVLQIMSFFGSAKTGIDIHLSFDSFALFAYDMIGLISCCFVGIIGAILLISGVRAYATGEQQTPIAENEVTQETNDEISQESEDVLKGFAIPLSVVMPILLSIFVILFIIVLMFEGS